MLKGGFILRMDLCSLAKQRGLVALVSHRVLAKNPKSAVVSPGWAGAGCWAESSLQQQLGSAAVFLPRLRLHDGKLIKDRRYHLRTYPNCFVAKELTDWLIDHKEAPDRETGIRLMQKLMDHYIIHHGGWVTLHPLSLPRGWLPICSLFVAIRDTVRSLFVAIPWVNAPGEAGGDGQAGWGRIRVAAVI